MLGSPLIVDTDVPRSVQPGDLILGGERLTLINNAAGVTVTGANLLTGIVDRTGAVAVTDTFDSASNIITALLANIYRGSGANTPRGLQNGTTFRLTYINRNSGTLTFAAGTGVTLTNMGTLAASSVRTAIVTLLNSTEPSVAVGTVTNASAVVTAMSAKDTSRVTAGMLVTGTNIPASTTVLSVQPGVGVTLSANATGTLSLNALTFSPVLSVTGIGTATL